MPNKTETVYVLMPVKVMLFNGEVGSVEMPTHEQAKEALQSKAYDNRDTRHYESYEEAVADLNMIGHCY